MRKGIQITTEEADKLLEEGVATLFDCISYEYPEASALGFFEVRPSARKEIILVINNNGYFIRAREDLVKSEDEVFVGFVPSPAL